MGGGSSTETPRTVEEEKKPELLEKPWRDVQWNPSTRNNLMKYILDYKPLIDSVPQARILLIGAITAGKSSFFNSINSIFRGNITSQADVGEIGTSLTLKYRTYQVRAGRGGQPLAFLLCDTMGLEYTKDGGVLSKDIVSILKGYIKDGYQFNPYSPREPDDGQTKVQLKDRIHCVVYVTDSSTLGIMPKETKNKVDEIRKETRLQDVPLMVLLTKVDKACPHVEKDLKNVYRSCYIKDLIYRASDCLGIPPVNVIPVKNYYNETELNDTCDILLLSAMKQMLHFADNHFDDCLDIGVCKMGIGNSTPVTEEKKTELLDTPWRNVVWDHSTRNNLKQYLLDYKPTIESVPQARILLIGQIKAGKSSFFNSINTIFRGNITSQAKTGESTSSLTLKYRAYQVRAGRGGQPLAFLLCDTMGLEPTPNGGVKIEDIESILKGCIPDKYQFNPVHPMKADDSQACSTLTVKDKIHCVVYVTDASTIGILDQGMKNKIDEIKNRTNLADVPLVVLLTKVDKACPHVEKDLRKVYHSTYIKEQIYRASECLGIPPVNVIPVKNYHDKNELNDTCDILLLSAMKQMLDFADNYLENCLDIGVCKMGIGNSTPVTEEKKSELLDTPWRNIVWDHSTRTDLMQYLLDYKPTIDSVPQARILLIGQIKAGKSSFFNSINSIFRGNITSQAKTGESTSSLTLKYRAYQVRAGRGGQPLAFLLCDTMGLEPTPNGGVKIEDIESILKGYVPDKYQFNPVHPMKADDSQACSTLTVKDRIHCVVYVTDTSTIGILDQGMKNKIDEINNRTNLADVPLVVLLTKVDKACPHVEKDLKKVYHSTYIKEQIDKASKCLGISASSVIPVKNYHDETELNDACDILLLSAMKQMLDFADNYFDDWEEDTE